MENSSTEIDQRDGKDLECGRSIRHLELEGKRDGSLLQIVNFFFAFDQKERNIGGEKNVCLSRLRGA